MGEYFLRVTYVQRLTKVADAFAPLLEIIQREQEENHKPKNRS